MTCKCGRPRYRTTSGVLVDKCSRCWWREESKKDAKIKHVREIIESKKCARDGCDELIIVYSDDKKSTYKKRYCCDLCRKTVAQELRKLTVEREKENAK